MRLAGTQQVGMVERLECEGNQLVALRQLRAGGIHFPAGADNAQANGSRASATDSGIGELLRPGRSPARRGLELVDALGNL